MHATRIARNPTRCILAGLGLLLLLAMASPSLAVTQHEVFSNANPFSSKDLTVAVPGFHEDSATLDNPAAARAFIAKMREIEGEEEACPLTPEEVEKNSTRDQHCLPMVSGGNRDIYVVIHLLRWVGSCSPQEKNNSTDPSITRKAKPQSESLVAEKPKVQSEHWYLYRDVPSKSWSQEDFATSKRILGVTRLYVSTVHLGSCNMMNPDGSATYKPEYDFTVTKKTPANLAHLYALIANYTAGKSSKQEQPAEKEAKQRNSWDSFWGGGILNLQYRPSDILIKSTFRIASGDPEQKLSDNITFDNEGLYHWDVGFAVPVRKISEIKLDATSGTATPADVSNTSVFAVLNGYIKPIDVKGSGFNAIPHPIAGVSFAKQPLSKILIGGAWGPQVSELYIGALFVKQPILSGNNSCSDASGASVTGTSHYCVQFSIGINLSVSAIASKLGAPK